MKTITLEYDEYIEELERYSCAGAAGCWELAKLTIRDLIDICDRHYEQLLEEEIEILKKAKGELYD